MDSIISILYNVSMFILVFAGFIKVLILLGYLECTKTAEATVFYKLPAMLKLLIITY
ncbi:hypothetical protein SAMN05421821_105261 [Mucilaginibacter lappiensis]|uniref:Uncharacterized protein n=1 Tax=Mucilaginibacter lappiensis TaxID=354630 RepID=A0ABR6PJ90_9SPHI|nr:hypothetical protein [Mucilaginibacter lappiensis]SIR17386.1 hypothetical protein SAMN05421821_105261 [Mucilaginibacter lappiensis]